MMWRFPHYYSLPYGAYYPQSTYTPYALHAFAPSYTVGLDDPFGAAQWAVKTMEGMLKAADPDAQFGHIHYADVVAAYQKAGQFGVDRVAPAIEQGGVPGVTQPLAKKAWDLNGQLHTAVRQWGDFGPGYYEAQQTKDLAWQMLSLYKNAIATGQQSVVRGGQRGPLQGAPSGPLQAAAQNLLAAIRSATQAGQSPWWTRNGGQSAYMWKPAADFQRAYNKASGSNLRVDGVFGAETGKALKSVVGTNRVTAASQHAAAGYR
jgi:hypothetical protein